MLRSTLRIVIPLAIALAVTAAAMALVLQGLQSVAAYHGTSQPNQLKHAVLGEGDASCTSNGHGQPAVGCPALTDGAFGGCPFVTRQTRGQCPGLAAPQDVPDRISCPFFDRSAPPAPAQQHRRLPDQVLVANVGAAARDTWPTDAL